MMTQAFTVPAFVELTNGKFVDVSKVACSRATQKEVLWASYSTKERKALRQFFARYSS